MHVPFIFLTILINLIVCRDFYVGMFKRNDFLVAQDRLYKEREYNRRVIAKYGRIFKCPITYIRIVDRLGIGRGPTAEIIRGGLLKNYVVLRIHSVYNYPISVNIYVGCENKMVREITVVTTTDSKVTDINENVTSAPTISTDAPSNDTSEAGKSIGNETTTVITTIPESNNTNGNKTE